MLAYEILYDEILPLFKKNVPSNIREKFFVQEIEEMVHASVCNISTIFESKKEFNRLAKRLTRKKVGFVQNTSKTSARRVVNWQKKFIEEPLIKCYRDIINLCKSIITQLLLAGINPTHLLSVEIVTNLKCFVENDNDLNSFTEVCFICEM